MAISLEPYVARFRRDARSYALTLQNIDRTSEIISKSSHRDVPKFIEDSLADINIVADRLSESASELAKASQGGVPSSIIQLIERPASLLKDDAPIELGWVEQRIDEIIMAVHAAARNKAPPSSTATHNADNKRAKRKGGRPRTSDPASDEKTLINWEAASVSKTEFARSHKVTVRVLSKTLDRARQTRRRKSRQAE